MRDDWYGHRDFFTGKPAGDKDEWTRLDYLVIEAYQIVEDITDETGMLIMDQDDEAVTVGAVRKINKFRAAIDNATKGSEKKPYKPRPGEYFVPDIKTRRSGDKRITYTEWREAKLEKPD